MKMKKGLLSVVFLLATSSAMAAMSYSSATVTNDMTGSVLNTNQSLVGIDITGKGHEAAKIENGVLKIDFNHKSGTSTFGMQKDSEYIWDNLFRVKNNSENPIDLTFNTENKVPTGVELWVRITDKADWQLIDDVDSEKTAEFKKWAVDQFGSVDLKVVVNDTALYPGAFNPNLVIGGTDASAVKK